MVRTDKGYNNVSLSVSIKFQVTCEQGRRHYAVYALNREHEVNLLLNIQLKSHKYEFYLFIRLQSVYNFKIIINMQHNNFCLNIDFCCVHNFGDVSRNRSFILALESARCSPFIYVHHHRDYCL